MDWFYADNDAHKGPISEIDLRKLLDAGGVTRETLVWNRTMPHWQQSRHDIPFRSSLSTTSFAGRQSHLYNHREGVS
jgi:hypothetical protein